MYDMSTIIFHIPNTLRQYSWQEKESRTINIKKANKIIIIIINLITYMEKLKNQVEKFRND